MASQEATMEPEEGPAKGPFKFIKGKDKKSDDELLVLFGNYNVDLSSKDRCESMHQKGLKLQCNCLSILSPNELEVDSPFSDAVAQYQLYFSRLKSIEQKKIVIEWMRSNPNNNGTAHRRYPIPFLLDNSQDSSTFQALREATVCPSSLVELLGRSKKWLKECVDHATNNTLPSHGLIGKTSNNRKAFLLIFEDDLVQHFEELRKEASPIATRLVRESTGETTTRDDDDDYELLGPDVTMRTCYSNFCLSKGVIVSATNKGTFKKRPLEGYEDAKTPSWSAYHSFWKQRYPKLKVRKPSADVCSYCFKFFNVRSTLNNSSIDTGNNNEQEQQEKEAVDNTTTTAASVDNTNIQLGKETSNINASSNLNKNTNEDEDAGDVSVDKIALEWERRILEASTHVRRARVQRALANQKIETAKLHKQQNVHHSERTYTFIADYCQNMSLPFFGSSQPGETYYYTPLNVYLFGVVDASADDHLHGHLYKEGDAKKGGNSVASLIIKTLDKIGLLKQDESGNVLTGKELNIIFDNCAGQNKNNYVLWLVPYLVELGYFESVNFIFLIVGHTKNACDRRFNNLKLLYSKSQCFSFDDMIEVLSKSKYVTIWPVQDGDIKDYAKWLQKYYKKLATVGILLSEYHIFSSNKSWNVFDLQYIKVRHSDLEEDIALIENILPKKSEEYSVRRASMKASSPNVIPFSGVPAFKQVQLFTNYRSLLPVEYQDKMCPKPSDDIMKKHKLDQEMRGENKKRLKQELQSIDI